MPALHKTTSPRVVSNPPAQESAQIEVMIEQTLALLADIERRYEHERSIIEEALHPQPWKDWRFEQLAIRHARERQLMIQRLCSLHQQRTTAALGFVGAMADLPSVTVPGGAIYAFALP